MTPREPISSLGNGTSDFSGGVGVSGHSAMLARPKSPVKENITSAEVRSGRDLLNDHRILQLTFAINKWPRDDMSVAGPPTEYAHTKRTVGIRPRQREQPTNPQPGLDERKPGNRLLPAAAVAVAVGLVAVAVRGIAVVGGIAVVAVGGLAVAIPATISTISRSCCNIRRKPGWRRGRLRRAWRRRRLRRGFS